MASKRLSNYVVATAAIVLFTGKLEAQDLSSYPLPPEIPMRDQFGVNVLSATWTYEQRQRLHSNIDPNLDFYLFAGDSGRNWGSSLQAYMVGDPNSYQTYYNVVIGRANYLFLHTQNTSVWTDKSEMGNKLIYDSLNNKYIFTRRDGVTWIFDPTIFNSQPSGGIAYCTTGKPTALPQVCGAAKVVSFPDGTQLSYEYDTTYKQDSVYPTHYFTYARVRAAHSSNGASVLVGYSSWFVVGTAKLINDAYDFCNYATRSCTANAPQPALSFTQVTATMPNGSSGITTTTSDQAGNVFKYDIANWASYFNAHKAGSGMPVAVNFVNDQGPSRGKGGPNPPSYINFTAPDGITYQYRYIDVYPPGCSTNVNLCTYDEVHVTRTSSDGRIHSFVGDRNGLRSTVVVQDTDELNRIKLISYDSYFRPIQVTQPEGNSDYYTYDQNGNVIQLLNRAKPGSGLADLQQTAVYPTSCSGPMICNKPMSVTDERGNATSYVWDQSNGNLLSKSLPADSSGVRPVKRFSYANMYAWVSNGSGGFVQSPTARSMLVEERTCITTATVGNSCAGGSADEVVTTYNYGPQSGPNNLLLRGKSVMANGTTLTGCYGYDKLGNKISETKPNANLQVCP